ncbi:MAG: type II toxin-antitoxin system RelE family toxin [Syntrophales bacterium]
MKDPARLGKPLKGLFEGLYAYRCGDSRVLYALDREQKMILIETVGDRKTVYKD